MNEDQLRAALQAEYLHLQKVIEDFDGRVLTIKAWSITFSLVALAGAFASHASAVFLVSSISALLFWFLEGSWKTFQYAHYDRSGKIEAYFRGEGKLDSAFQIGTSWHRGWISGGPRTLRQIMLWPHVALPHVVVAAIGLVLFSLNAAGVIRP
jgi:hypothetical protein